MYTNMTFWTAQVIEVSEGLCIIINPFQVVLYPGLVLPQLDLKRWMVGLEALGFTGEQTGTCIPR